VRIDVHSHHYPAAYLEIFSSLGYPELSRGPRLAPGAHLTIDERIGLLDEVGIDLQVLSAVAPGPYLPVEVDAVRAARLANDLYADLFARYPRRLAGFGTVPLPHVRAAVAEAERCLDTLGMLGLTIGCSVAGRQLDDAAFAPFWAALDERGAVLFLHPQGVGCGPGTTDYGLGWLLGAPVEDTVAALRLVLSGLIERFPRVRIIVPHLGGVLPFLLQRIDDTSGHAVVRLRDTEEAPGIDGPPSRYYRRLWFDTVNSHPAALRCACESFGADRLLLGTDFPFRVGPHWAPLVRYIEDAGLSPADTEAILGGNAQLLLGLGSPPRAGGGTQDDGSHIARL
jgi:aminocarboxymuconate-semialdehyde decarboxylase